LRGDLGLELGAGERPGSPEAVSRQSGHPGRSDLDLMVPLLDFCGRHIAKGAEEASVVEPIDLFKRGHLHRFDVAPGPLPTNHMGLAEAHRGLGHRVIIRIPHTALRRVCGTRPPRMRRRSSPGSSSPRRRLGNDLGRGAAGRGRPAAAGPAGHRLRFRLPLHSSGRVGAAPG